MDMRQNMPGAYTDSSGYDVIDEWGRVIPDPVRWPSSRGGKGFAEVARKVHGMGLKFGIHVMRGISVQAVNANKPILDSRKGRAYEEAGRQWMAKDIGQRERTCAWMPHGFMSVNTQMGAGRAFLRSLYQQYAEWGVDFVKHDCIFGEDLDKNEITVVSEVLKELDRPILYSLSPGARATPDMAKDIANLVNMYRVTGDDWDKWEDVKFHFNVARDFAASNLIGAEGLGGKSWPDLDMLPLGWLTDPGSNEGPHRKSRLTGDEEKTQMTLWSMAKSPLMLGGDLRQIDRSTLSLISNPILLEINSFSANNKEFPYIMARKYQLESSNYISTRIHRSLKHENQPHEIELAVTSCKAHWAKGWVVQSSNGDRDMICWKDSLHKDNFYPFCLSKRRPILTWDEEIIYKEHYEGKFHLAALEAREFCLDAVTNKKFPTEKLRNSSLSPCKWDAKQMWELNPNGTLVSSYSGLCATMKTIKDNGDGGGVRSWVATGRRGEIYVSYFNLNPEKMVISSKISDLGKVVPPNFLRKYTCNCNEVWSGKDVKIAEGTLPMEVEAHGCALFILNCN